MCSIKFAKKAAQNRHIMQPTCTLILKCNLMSTKQVFHQQRYALEVYLLLCPYRFKQYFGQYQRLNSQGFSAVYDSLGCLSELIDTNCTVLRSRFSRQFLQFRTTTSTNFDKDKLRFKSRRRTLTSTDSFLGENKPH